MSRRDAEGERIDEMVMDAVDSMREAPTIDEMVSRMRGSGTPISPKLVTASVRRLVATGVIARATGFAGNQAHYERALGGDNAGVLASRNPGGGQ